jgi:nucleolar pre-ribosomal-associated protein 1
MDNIFPPVSSKPLITKGLQSNSALVQHKTALCLTQSLMKFKTVSEALKVAEMSLEETNGMGQWSRRRKDLEAEVKRRVPNFEVIVAFCQRKLSSLDWGSDMTADSPQKRLNVSMVAESALRLMWLYHEALPSIPAEARFDVGRLLTTGIGKQLIGFTPSLHYVDEEAGFNILSKLHLLQLLQHSDQFAWSHTSGVWLRSAITVTYTMDQMSPIRPTYTISFISTLQISILSCLNDVPISFELY